MGENEMNENLVPQARIYMMVGREGDTGIRTRTGRESDITESQNRRLGPGEAGMHVIMQSKLSQRPGAVHTTDVPKGGSTAGSLIFPTQL